jgi:hypothetical protein
MHGSRRPETILSGPNHPNFVHGRATKKARKTDKSRSLRLHQLLEVGKLVELFEQGTALRGRKPKS